MSEHNAGQPNKPLDIDAVVDVTLVGVISHEIATLIGDPHLAGQIFIGPSNVTHMKDRHPDDYAAYKDHFGDILAEPDYVGIDPANGSIQFVRILDKNVSVSVRVSKSGKYFARSMYALSEHQFSSYTTSGRLHKVK